MIVKYSALTGLFRTWNMECTRNDNELKTYTYEVHIVNLFIWKIRKPPDLFNLMEPNIARK